jgi:GTP diphosphokinase / guanosine-3',5'-bis(diphosphate) 3'-diphosphatase
MNLAEFIIKVESFNANIDIPLIRKAYEFSDRIHKGQLRQSGVPYVEHCLEVAFILAEQHLDSTTIAAGLIHDVVEDTEATLTQLKVEFGEEIAELVDGVTKISELEFRSQEEEQAEYFRKLLLSMAKDIRVIIIKLADRLHNMRTLDPLDPEKQMRIAQETRDIYAPLAHRFGMARIEWELEDLSLRYLEAEVYEELLKKVEEKREDREAYIQEISQPLQRELGKAGIKAKITGRPKHFYSIYLKMKKRNKPFEEIYDLFAIRVMVSTEAECYHVLGIVHTLWKPVEDRFHDYIALPKSNMYRSLHTTVIGPRGRMVEIQIRTHEMHHAAEYGIAAHWLYKEGKRKLDETDRQMIWLREVLEWQKDLTNPKEFLEYLKVDLFHDDIFVYTPKGELKQLPRGSTPLDFAYTVHSDIGDHCVGVKVNGRMVPLSTVLNSGDEVDIITSPHQAPSQDWLKIVKTAKARSRIKQWLKQKGYEQGMVLGKEIFEKELKRQHLQLPPEEELIDLAMSLNYSSLSAMFYALGSGGISMHQILGKLAPEKKEIKESLVEKLIHKAKGVGKGIKVQGEGNMMFRFAQCCQPLPGEKIVGFVTRGRGVSIHRADCVNILQMMGNSERQVEVEWDVGKDESFVVRLELVLEDRKNMLRDITEAIADTDANVRGAEIKSGETMAMGDFLIEIRNLNHLNRTIKRIKEVKGVVAVKRAEGVEFPHE